MLGFIWYVLYIQIQRLTSFLAAFHNVSIQASIPNGSRRSPLDTDRNIIDILYSYLQRLACGLWENKQTLNLQSLFIYSS